MILKITKHVRDKMSAVAINNELIKVAIKRGSKFRSGDHKFLGGYSFFAVAYQPLARMFTRLTKNLKNQPAEVGEHLETLETEHGAAQEALRKGEERFRKIFDHSNDAIFVVDAVQDEMLDVNSKACEMLGYSREELLSMPMSAIHPYEMPKLQAFAKSVARSGHGWTDELTCLTRTGQFLPSEISASLIDVSGRSCMIALVRDISERKRAQERLKESEEKYRLITETSLDGIYQVDTSGKFLFLNEAYAKIFGYEVDELIGKHLSVLQGSKLQEAQELFEKLVSGKAVRGEIAVKHKDGHEFPSSFSAVPIEKGGKVVGLSGVVRYISEQEKATQVLRQMALFAELNPGPVLRFDHNGVILSSNPAALTVLGEKAKEGSQLASVTPAMADIDLEWCIREGLVLVHEELVGQKHFQLVIRGVPELGIGHVYGSDISERKRAEKKLQSVNERMKSDLETAAKMQLSLLPRARPDVPGVRLAWAFKPCEELAGDIFNVFLLDKKHLACISHHCSSRSGGRAGLTRRTTETDAGVLVQYVEEVEGAQRRQDGWFRRCSRVVMRNAG